MFEKGVLSLLPRLLYVPAIDFACTVVAMHATLFTSEFKLYQG